MTFNTICMYSISCVLYLEGF